MRWILLFLISNICIAQERRVIILDTGLSLKDPRFSNLLCKDYQGIDFTGEGIIDTEGHGTHIAGLIKENAKNSNYCITIIKYYSSNVSGRQNLKNIIKALSWISWIEPSFVNFSGGGPEWNDEEYSLINKSQKTKFIVSAGNNNENLDINCNFYPACYKLKNIYIVGALDVTGNKLYISNYGSIINFWQLGEIVSTVPNNKNGYMIGTSQATAILNR